MQTHKTTIELPTALFFRMKQATLERRVTLKEFISGAIKDAIEGVPSEKRVSKNPRIKVNANGLPYFSSGGGIVTDELVNRIRDEEGI